MRLGMKTSIAVLNTLGLDCLEPDIVNKLASQQLKDIRNAFIHGSSSMKALLVAVMFSTTRTYGSSTTNLVKITVCRKVCWIWPMIEIEKLDIQVQRSLPKRSL